jgi:hypothetical protein
VGGPKISSTNRKSANLPKEKLSLISGHFANVAICRFANPIILLFADPIFVDLLPQIGKFIISLLKNIGLKCSTSNLYKIKISSEQTCGRIIGGFVEQGPKSGRTF